MSLFTTLLIGGGAVWLYNLKEAADKLSVNILNLWKATITNGKLQLWVKVELGNFSGTHISIKQPDVAVSLADNPIGNSIPDNTFHQIPSGTKITIDIPFEIPLLNIPFAVAALMQGQQSGRLIKVDVTTVFNGIRYTDSTTYTI